MPEDVTTPQPPHNPPTVVLVRPREQGNVGAVCRAMANMGLSDLRLVEPAATLGGTARAFAVGAHDILESLERYDRLEDALAPFERVVATTSARDRKLAVPVLTPRELPAALAEAPDRPTALVFGSEVGGLTNDEMAMAHLMVTIPCSIQHPTLNLAQAVLVVAYELWTATGAPPLVEETGAEPPATTAELEGLCTHWREIMEVTGFARDESFEIVARDLRQTLGRAELTAREVVILRGMLRRTGHAVRLGGTKGEPS